MEGDIDRDISSAKNDIDRDISLAENDGSQKAKNNKLYMIL